MGKQKRKIEAQRSRHRRRLIGFAIGILLVVVAASFAMREFVGGVAQTIDPGSDSENAADEFAGGPPSLFYVDFAEGTDLHLLDLDEGSDEVVGELSRSGNTTAAPGSRWLSVEVLEEVGEKGSQPAIYLYDHETEEETRVGVGFGPTWTPDGKLLAWNQPEDESLCGEEDCRGDIRAVVTDPETGETTPWTEPGPYDVTAWAGDYLIVSDSPPGGEPILQSVSPDGELQRLSVRPLDFWGVSPDGRWVVQSSEEAPAMFLEMEDGQISGQGETIGIPEGTKLGEGAWAHDSSHVAAFATLDGRALDFVTFGPDDPEPEVRDEGGETSTGAVLWTPDNDGVVFQRFTGDELEAVYCPLDGDCEPALSWTTGISLLRVE